MKYFIGTWPGCMGMSHMAYCFKCQEMGQTHDSVMGNITKYLWKMEQTVDGHWQLTINDDDLKYIPAQLQVAWIDQGMPVVPSNSPDEPNIPQG
jgi:hypothetical protein